MRWLSQCCLYAGGAVLALDIFGAAPLLALAGSVPEERTLTMLTGLLFCTALSAAAIAMLFAEDDSEPSSDTATD